MVWSPPLTHKENSQGQKISPPSPIPMVAQAGVSSEALNISGGHIQRGSSSSQPWKTWSPEGFPGGEDVLQDTEAEERMALSDLEQRALVRRDSGWRGGELEEWAQAVLARPLRGLRWSLILY